MKKLSFGRKSSLEPVRYGQADGARGGLRQSSELSTRKKSHIPRPRGAGSVERPRRSLSIDSGRTHLSQAFSKLAVSSKKVSNSNELLFTPQCVRKQSQMPDSVRSGMSDFSVQRRGTRSAMKDSRGGSDKSQVKMWESRVAAFLIENGFSNSNPFQNIRSFTTATFMDIFNFLYKQICTNESKVSVSDVADTLKRLGCKEIQGIKSALKTVGSLHSWPRLIGLLYFLVQFIECSNGNVLEILFRGMDEDVKVGEMLGNEYFIKSYQAWNVRGDEGVEEETRTFKEELIRMKNVKHAELIHLEEEKKEQECKHENLPYFQSCQEVQKLEAKNKMLLDDKETVVTYINDYECYRESLTNQIGDIEKRCEECKDDISKKEEYLHQLESLCANQEMSLTEKHKIMSECNDLKRQIGRIEIEIQGMSTLLRDLETKWARRKNEFDDLCASFNTKLHNLESYREKEELRIHSLDIEEAAMETLKGKLKNLKKSMKQHLKGTNFELEEDKKSLAKEQQRLEKLKEEKKDLAVKIDVQEAELEVVNQDFEEDELKLKQEIDAITLSIYNLNQSLPDDEGVQVKIQRIQNEKQQLNNKLKEIDDKAVKFFDRLIPMASGFMNTLLEESRELKKQLE